MLRRSQDRRSRLRGQVVATGVIAVVDTGLGLRYPDDRPLGYVVAAVAAVICVDRLRRMRGLPAGPPPDRGHINADP